MVAPVDGRGQWAAVLAHRVMLEAPVAIGRPQGAVPGLRLGQALAPRATPAVARRERPRRAGSLRQERAELREHQRRSRWAALQEAPAQAPSEAQAETLRLVVWAEPTLVLAGQATREAP
jgi:hypothetical protein